MNNHHLPEEYGELLNLIAESLDIPDHAYEDAVLKYENVGDWLGEQGSPLAPYEPQIYPQGSFRLGTVVRPLRESDEFDIDLVCQLEIEKESITKNDLKHLVGDRLKENAELAAILEESRRCWSLEYKTQFHMDVLPSLPNVERKPTGILLTDRELRLWQKSNPIAYADWFNERMELAFQQRKIELAESRMADIEEVPDWQVRTPLQRVVQLLKRHRDIYFEHDEENRPVSIIITTLAALAYGNQMDLVEALSTVLEQMPQIGVENGQYVIPNPVEPDENFADKWNENPERRDAFVEWLLQVKRDFLEDQQDRTLTEAAETLAPIVGKQTVDVAVTRLGGGGGRESAGSALSAVTVPELGPAAHRQDPPWDEDLTHKVKVLGGVFMQKQKGKKLWNLTSRPVPKGVWLKFSTKTNVRPPFEVRWQVVNTGDEAAADNGLRGGFETESGFTRWETTKYWGTHWIEAFVVKDGTCVARSGRVFVKVRD